jgi:hypothetical protein
MTTHMTFHCCNVGKYQIFVIRLIKTVELCCEVLIFLMSMLDDLYKVQSSLLCNILMRTVTSSFLGPNIFLSTLISNFVIYVLFSK